MNFNYVKIMFTPNKETEQIDSPKERKSRRIEQFSQIKFDQFSTIKFEHLLRETKSFCTSYAYFLRLLRRKSPHFDVEGDPI